MADDQPHPTFFMQENRFVRSSMLRRVLNSFSYPVDNRLPWLTFSDLDLKFCHIVVCQDLTFHCAQYRSVDFAQGPKRQFF
jgi:hypothetical protein